MLITSVLWQHDVWELISLVAPQQLLGSSRLTAKCNRIASWLFKVHLAMHVSRKGKVAPDRLSGASKRVCLIALLSTSGPGRHI